MATGHTMANLNNPQALIKGLITMSQTVASFGPVTVHHQRNTSMMVRRIKLLTMLFEELSISQAPLPPSALICLKQLSFTIRRAELLLKDCLERSSMWQIVYSEAIVHQFKRIAEAMDQALDVFPLQLMDIPEELREQIELVHVQLKRTKIIKEAADERVCSALLSAIHDMERKADCNAGKMQWILEAMDLYHTRSCHKEIRLLEQEIHNQAYTGKLATLSTISKLITFLRYATCVIYGQGSPKNCYLAALNPHLDKIANQASVANISDDDLNSRDLILPDEFRCPVSLELMTDPVVVATGHTYDRCSITRWIESGHSTCPKSGQKLLHVSLIPNYALRSLISQWCAQKSLSLGNECGDKINLNCQATDRSNVTMTHSALEDARTTASFLVRKLATGSPEIQRQVAYEIRLLAKSSEHNRICIAEAGAIPFLVSLLSSKDPQTQENVMTALLNVSIYDHNKALIMASGAVNAIVSVLQAGQHMESRENAAATLFSLSLVNEYKVAIGNHPHAIPSLVDLLRQGSPRGKKDAATALFNLSIFAGNKPKVVVAGAIPVLVSLLTDGNAGLTDDALAVLAILAPCAEGLMAIRKTRAIPLLVKLLTFGSTKGKENSTAVLLALCKSGGGEVKRSVLILPTALSSLQRLALDGSPRAQRKASLLLKILRESDIE